MYWRGKSEVKTVIRTDLWECVERENERRKTEKQISSIAGPRNRKRCLQIRLVVRVKILQQERLKLAQGREVGGHWDGTIVTLGNGRRELRHKMYI